MPTKVEQSGETKDYINEANRQLNVTFNYKNLPNHPTVTHNKLINHAIGRFKQDSEAPKFNMLPNQKSWKTGC